MATEQIDITSHEVLALLNVLAAKKRPLTVEVPWIKANVLTYDAEQGSITRGIKRADYTGARNRVLPGPSPFESEIPAWPHIQDALQSSGAVHHANASHMASFLQDLEGIATDPGRAKMMHLGFDTNILYKRWPSRRIHALLGNDKPQIRFALSAGVREELDARAKAKFSEYDEVKAFQELVGGDKAKAITNRAKRANRIASSALGEFDLLAKTRRSHVINCEPLSSDREENDRVIAASYARLDQRNDIEVRLLTADSGMMTHAHSKGLPYELLKNAKPDRIPTGPMAEETLCHLIHDLAAQAMLIHLQPCDIWIWSDWNGKHIGDWAAERLRLEYDPANQLAATFIQDLEAARAVLEAEQHPTVGTKIRAAMGRVKEAIVS